MRMVTAMTGANNSDLTWHYIVNLIWWYALFPSPFSLPTTDPCPSSFSLVEAFTGIICACLPSLKPFTKRFFPALFLFNPSFEQRLSSGLPFSTLRGNNRRHDGDANNRGAAGSGEEEDRISQAGETSNGGENDGGRKAWWRLRRGGEDGERESVGKGSVEGGS